MVNLEQLLKFIYLTDLLQNITLTHTVGRFFLFTRFKWFIYGPSWNLPSQS